MGNRQRYLRSHRSLLAAGVGLAALTASAGALAEGSEMDAYNAAVNSQSEADALHFVRDFAFSDMTDDLIRSLRSDVALQVCVELQGGRTADEQDACQAFPTASTLPAAGAPPVNAQSPAAPEPDLSATQPDLFATTPDLFDPAAAPASNQPVAAAANTNVGASSSGSPV